MGGNKPDGLKLYNFVDNHDVERIGSILREKEHIQNVYTLLFTMPGVPSVYYGSEWAIEGKKERGSDKSLRPTLDLEEMLAKDQSLVEHISKLAAIREQNIILQEGSYEQVVVRNQQLIFARVLGDKRVYVALNLQEQEMELEFRAMSEAVLVNLLDPEKKIACNNGQYKVKLKPFTSMILEEE